MNEELKNILIKVRELYMKYGIKSITMDDVAREISISKKTLYQYVQIKMISSENLSTTRLQYGRKKYVNVLALVLNAIEELFEISFFMNKLIARSERLQLNTTSKNIIPNTFRKL
jgi:AcrR family transcriptional regulator